MEMNEEEEIKTVVGVFEDNFITTTDGEKIHARAYRHIHDDANHKFGVFNIKWSNVYNGWLVTEYVLLNENIDLE